jgi:hypothetical protein
MYVCMSEGVCVLYRQFTKEHAASLANLMKLYEAPAAEFPWDLEEVKFWFDGSHKPLTSTETALSRLRDLRPDPDYLCATNFYICDPPGGSRRDNKPFWIARLLAYNEHKAQVRSNKIHTRN